jgi:hypothetical protein
LRHARRVAEVRSRNRPEGRSEMYIGIGTLLIIVILVVLLA